MMSKPILSAIFIAALSTRVSALEIGLGEGQLFPDLSLTALEGGKLQSPSSFRGQKLLLHVFASW